MKAGVITRASMSQGDGEIDQFMRSGTAAFSIVTDYEMKVLNDPKNPMRLVILKMPSFPVPQVRSVARLVM